MVKRNLTGAGFGFISWLQQRITAIIMLIFAIIFLISVFLSALHINSSITSWQSLFSCTLIKIVVQIFFLAVILHAWVGIRDIWMDYIKCNSLKLTLHVLTILWLFGSLIYSIKVIW